MITWIRDLIFGKNYGKAPEPVNNQITDSVTTKKTKKTSTPKVTKTSKTTKKPPVKKNTTRKTK